MPIATTAMNTTRTTATTPPKSHTQKVHQTTSDTATKNKKRTPTPFQQRVYSACSCIPRGKVSTYGILAAVLHSHPRAVGQALRNNPFAPVVPCHRVVAASLELGGFSGSWGPECASVKRKKAMLEGEGVFFDTKGKLRDAGQALMTAKELQLALKQ